MTQRWPQRWRRLLARLVLPIAAILTLAPACTGSGPTVRLADGQPAAAHGEADVSGVTTTVIELGDYFFQPTILRGAPGQHLTVTLSNQGNALHDFRIASQHIDANVEAGTPVTVTVTFPQAGAVTFECRYHLLQNMRGELVAGGG
ncbi:MAG TPA: cupredoxin domain-containing protein [Actinomycetota bacterium]|nr:cupredoxin domain-containing protein [Actinomycetota bacterium]